MSKKTIGVYIGRFQPFHKGHESLVKKSFEKFDRTIVLVGSANRPTTIRNPWPARWRARMIEKCFPEEIGKAKLIIEVLNDFTYRDELWIKSVQSKVDGILDDRELQDYQPVLWGHDKDHSSYYLNLFPKWDSEGAPAFLTERSGKIVNATKIRELLFSDKKGDGCSYLPDPVVKIVKDYMKYPYEISWLKLQMEWDFVQEYQKAWIGAPYPPTFVTTDAIVVCSGHILLVTRGDYPGKGLLALPGGFLDKNETLVDCVVRELKEETRLKMPPKAIEGCIERQHVFDGPHRSTRGRTITHAFYFHLKPGVLPEVRGGDDAAEADWYPLSEVSSSRMYEDHYDIIRYFTG